MPKDSANLHPGTATGLVQTGALPDTLLAASSAGAEAHTTASASRRVPRLGAKVLSAVRPPRVVAKLAPKVGLAIGRAQPIALEAQERTPRTERAALVNLAAPEGLVRGRWWRGVGHDTARPG